MPKNILINGETLDVKFIDADSYGMSLTPKGGSHDVYYPPPATTRGYRSPRTATISGPDNKIVKDYNKFDDNYALAIHMFMLLVPGFHPWNGISPETEAAACSRRFQYAGPTKSLSNSSPQMQLFNALPLPIQGAFVAAFVDVNPPTPTQWRALFKAHWGHLPRPRSTIQDGLGMKRFAALRRVLERGGVERRSSSRRFLDLVEAKIRGYPDPGPSVSIGAQSTPSPVHPQGCTPDPGQQFGSVSGCPDGSCGGHLEDACPSGPSFIRQQ